MISNEDRISNGGGLMNSLSDGGKEMNFVCAGRPFVEWEGWRGARKMIHLRVLAIQSEQSINIVCGPLFQAQYIPNVLCLCTIIVIYV
jgi:hypothetical protein